MGFTLDVPRRFAPELNDIKRSDLAVMSREQLEELAWRLHELARLLANRAGEDFRPVRVRRRATTPIGVKSEANRLRPTRTAPPPIFPTLRPRKPASRTRTRPPRAPANSPARKGIGAVSRLW